MSTWDQKGWQEITVGNDTYLIVVDKEDGEWKILLTNLKELWIESLSDVMILSKVQKLNPLLNVPNFDSNKIIDMIVNDVPKYMSEASVTEIKLRVPIEGGILKYTFNLTKATPEQFWENVTKPLCLTSLQLTKQHQILLNIVKKKDEEIAEYKAEGAELIRKNIETKVFNAEQLKLCIPSIEPNSCINAFKEVTTIYRSINLPKQEIKKEPGSLDSSTVVLNEQTEAGKESKPIKETNACGTSKQKETRKHPTLIQSSLQSTSIAINKGTNKRRKLTDFIL